jgi:hypothetical protein
MPASLLLQPGSLADARKLLEQQERTPDLAADSTASTGSRPDEKADGGDRSAAFRTKGVRNLGCIGSAR